MDLLFEEDPFLGAYFVLVDDVYCSGHGGDLMDGFSQLIELVLLEAGRQQFVLILNAAFNLLDKVGLLELHLRFTHHSDG